MVVFEFAVYLRTRLAAYCAIVRPPIELLRVSYVRYKIIQGVYKSQSDECDERNSKKKTFEFIESILQVSSCMC